MPDRRKLPSSEGLPSKHDVGRFTAANIVRLTALGLFLFFGLASVAAASVWFGLLAAFFFGQFLYTLLPVEQIRGAFRRAISGDAGEEAYDETVARFNDRDSRLDRLKGWLR